MRVSLAEIQAYARTLARLSDVAAERTSAAIALWMTEHPDASVAECRQFAISAVNAAVARYGDAAAENAAKLYDETMLAEGVDVPPAAIYEGADTERIEGTVRRLAGRLAGDEPDREGFLEQVGKLAADQTRAAASETVISNVERDSATKKGRGVRFARIPQRPDPCGYCVMLASRGFDYKSNESAAAASHHNCTCLVMAGAKGRTAVEDYDPEGMYERYKMCRKTIEHELTAERQRLIKANSYDADAYNEWCKDRIVDEMNTRDRRWLKTGRIGEPYTILPKAAPEDKEKDTARRLGTFGFRSEFRPTRGSSEKRTSDTYFVSGGDAEEVRTEAEFKQPEGDGRWTVFHQFEEAATQSRLLVIDISKLEKPETGETWNRESIEREVVDQIERTFHVPKGKHKGEPWEFREVLLVSDDEEYCKRFVRKKEIKN